MSDNVYMMRTPTHAYKAHEEIPSSVAGYVLTVADASNVGEIPLDDINSFLNGLDEWVDDVHNPTGAPIGYSVSFE